MIRQAVILAGGLGTRLRQVISEIPKPMAPVADRPFLEYLLKHLNSYDIEKAVLSVGYKYEVIRDHFGDKYGNTELVYAVEEEPLGTGGGIRNALRYVDAPECFLLNGDTYFNVPLGELYAFHKKNHDSLTLSLKKMRDFNRYGTVTVLNDRVMEFEPKKQCREGLINGGVYVLSSNIFEGLSLQRKFSFEEDFLKAHTRTIRMGAFISDGYFIDIGVPEDYKKAEREMGKRI